MQEWSNPIESGPIPASDEGYDVIVVGGGPGGAAAAGYHSMAGSRCCFLRRRCGQGTRFVEMLSVENHYPTSLSWE